MPETLAKRPRIGDTTSPCGQPFPMYAEHQRVQVGHCKRPRRAGIELCAEHRVKIWGFDSMQASVRKAAGSWWVRSTGFDTSAVPWRTHWQALRYADFLAREARWQSARRRSREHNCSYCSGWSFRLLHRGQVCWFNSAGLWLLNHKRPVPSRDARHLPRSTK